MKAARRATRAIVSQTIVSQALRLRRWPLALGLAVTMVVSLFHDLPALAGRAESGAIPVVAALSTSAPVQAPDAQAPALGCHCLCHMAGQVLADPVVTPVAFGDSLALPPASTAPPSCAGLPPFRPPRA